MNAGTSQQFCVRWNSHLGSLGAAFPQLLASQRFVDVTLACEGHQLHCHRLVLAACSTYFESVLNENPCKHPIIILPRDIRLWEIQALVDFMYKGEVNVSQAGLSDLLKCAEIFQIRGLCGSDAALNLDQINATSSPTAQSSAMPAGSTQSAAAAAAENSPGVTGSTTRSSSTNQQQTGTTAGATLAIATSSSSSSSSTSSTTSSSSTSSSSTPASTSTKDINNQNRNLVNRTKNTISSNNDNHSSNSSSNNRAAAASASTVAGINPNLSTTLPNVATAELSNSSFLNLTRGKLNAHKNDLQRYNTSTPNHSIISKTEPIDDEPMDDDLDDNSNNDSMDILGAVDKTDDEFTEYIKGSSKLQADFPLANVICEYENSGNLQLNMNNVPGRRVRRSEALLRQAAECVSRGQTFQTVSDMFNIPISTIRFFMARKGILPRRKRGRSAGMSLASNNSSNNDTYNMGSDRSQHSRSASPSEPPFHFANYKLPELKPKLL